MLVILTDEQIVPTEQVCPSCLLADRSGTPRWREGRLSCGQHIETQDQNRCALYRCRMGFKLACIG